jgi:predicted nucleotidyltransferase
MNSRLSARRGVLKGARFLRTLREVMNAMNKVRWRYALIGGLAVAHHANPPVTVDADFLIDNQNMDVLEILFRGAGWRLFPIVFSTRRRGLPKFGWSARKPGRTNLDLISTSGDAYLSRVVRSARPALIGGMRVPVAMAEDLIVMKTLVGREKDIADTIALRMRGKINEKYVNRELRGFKLK